MGIRQICIHGHFYQPPREDPVSGSIPIEPGATPFRNWNERIHSECYLPNAEMGNFERISFNVGPTLMVWMEQQHRRTYQQILEQDRRNVARYGVGNAIAMAYNHAILPLAKREDKRTQVVWGIADFEHRFGRRPKGMWLPETAVDTETLEILAEAGIEFTILAPWQASVEKVDPTQPYRVPLPSGRNLSVFFYHQDLSTRISFDPSATTNADQFLRHYVLPRYQTGILHANRPRLLMIASDGELYGHHQHFRDRFLAHLLDGALTSEGLEYTFPEKWLAQYPPTATIQIRENTSWSCHHGVLRWSKGCSCTPHPGWKDHLRIAMDTLAGTLDENYIRYVSTWIEDPWQLRNDYIQVMLGRVSPAELIFEHAKQHLGQTDLEKIELLLLAQLNRQRMFTSCGWFFDDFDRIEPQNNIAYAAQAVWMTKQACQVDLEAYASQLFHDVRSIRSGLHGEKVFQYYYQRASQSAAGVNPIYPSG